jgi:hypothetical protein
MLGQISTDVSDEPAIFRVEVEAAASPESLALIYQISRRHIPEYY